MIADPEEAQVHGLLLEADAVETSGRLQLT
jgi:hypothetical protein